MSIKANYLKIGVFVVFTLVLLTGGVIFWGASAFRQEKYYVETYIDQSVQGLTVGSPVYSRGVQVGEVAKIAFVPAIYDLPVGSEAWDKYAGYVYVLIALTYDRLLARADPAESLQMTVDRGYRVRISSNPLTGIAYLQGDYLDPNEHPPLSLAWKPEHVYIPWSPSVISEFVTELESVMKRVKELDIEGVVDRAKTLVTDLDQAVLDVQTGVLSAKAQTLIGNAGGMINDAKSMLRTTQTARAPTTVEDILNRVDKTVQDLDQTVANADIEGISDDAKQLLVELRDSNHKLQTILRSTESTEPPTAIDQVLAEVDMAVRRINLLMKQYGPDIHTTVSNVTTTSENLKEATEGIKRQPSKLLFSQPPSHSEVVE